MDQSSPEGDRPDSARLARKLLFGAIKRRRRHFILSLSCALVYVAGQAVIPLLSKRAFDDVLIGRRIEGLPTYMAALAILGVIVGVFGGTRKYQAAKLMAHVGN